MLKWLLQWKAERNGRRDGRNAIPSTDDPKAPPYLIYIHDSGKGRLDRLGLKWRLRDRKLLQTWLRRKTLCAQAQAALTEAKGWVRSAMEKYDASPKAKHGLAVARARRAVARAQARLNRAQLRLTHAAARRQARWHIYQARLTAVCGETDELMQAYVAANVGAREDGRVPLGLLDENRPRLVVPEALQQLTWPEAGGAAWPPDLQP